MAEGSRVGWKQCYGAIRKRLPVLKWLPQYSLPWLQFDLIAGLTVGLTVVPQALAYAVVAGLPVQYGLYSSFMGCFVYFLLGTSKDVTLGPTAIMSLLVSSYAFHDPAYAILLAFLSGCIQLAMGVLHLGFLLDFVSYPVIKGFTSAAAVTIGFSQVKALLGLRSIPRQFVLQVYYTFCKIGEAKAGDAVLGLFCLIVLVGLQQMKKSIPRGHRTEKFSVRISQLIVWTAATARNALVVLFAGLVAYSFQVTGSQPFTLTGATPQGLPPFQPPPFSKVTPNGTISFGKMVQAMADGLVVVPLMGLLETVAIAKSFASLNNYQIDPNQELLAMGFTNILGSFVSSYPVTGSFGRTALNAHTGVCTPAGGLITGSVVLLSLAYLTSLFYYIPKAALAAVIICAVAPMFDAKIFWTLWQVKIDVIWTLSHDSWTSFLSCAGIPALPPCLSGRLLEEAGKGSPCSYCNWIIMQKEPEKSSHVIAGLDLVPLCVTFLLCFWEVQYGIIAGVLASGVLLLYPIARPRIKVLEHGALVIQPASGLNFPAVEFLRDAVHKRALSEPQLRSVILDCTHVSDVDYTVVLGLSELLQEFQHKRLSLVFSGLQAHVLRVFLAANLEGFYSFPSLMDAEKSLKGELGSPREDFFDDDSEAILPTAGIIQ